MIAPVSADPKALVASAVLVMSKTDVASLQQKDQEDWKKRGTTGTVTAIDPATHKITIKSGPRTYTVVPGKRQPITATRLIRPASPTPGVQFRGDQKWRSVARLGQQG